MEAGTLVNGKKKSNKRLWVIVAAIWVVALVAYFYIPVGYLCASSEVREDPRESLLAAAPEWTPDGSRIVFGHWGGIYAINQDGSALNRVHGSGGEDDLYHTPAIYGDGSRIAYSKYQGGERWERLSSDLDGSDVRETSESFDRGFKYLPWFNPYSVSPDKSRIAFVEMETMGESRRQARVLYASENPKEEDMSGWTELAEGDRIKSPRWSPDGSQLAFVKLSPVLTGDGSYIYKTQVMALSGSDLDTVHQVADGPGGYFDFEYVSGYVDSPYGFYDIAWSPDGTKLLISGSSSISVVNVDGSGLKTLVKLRDNPIRQLHLSWSPDGSKIAVYNGNAYERATFTEGALFTMSPDGSDKRALVEYGDPLRLAQDQSWDPSLNAPPAPTPAPSATPNPAATANPSAPASTPAPTSGSAPPTPTPTPLAGTGGGKPPLTRADAPGGTKDPRIVRNVGGFDPTTPIRGGAAYGHTHVSTEAVHGGRGLIGAALSGYAELAHVVSYQAWNSRAPKSQSKTSGRSERGRSKSSRLRCSQDPTAAASRAWRRRFMTRSGGRRERAPANPAILPVREES